MAFLTEEKLARFTERLWANILSKTETDTGLSTSGKPADAKAVGDAIANISVEAPVESVNGKTGVVELTASDVGALPNTTSIPSALSQLTQTASYRTVTDTEKATWNAKSTFSGSYNDLTNKPGLATVATSGSYNDLTNKPTIPAAVTVDSALSSSSTNPVQNKIVNSALSGKAPTSHASTGTGYGVSTASNYGHAKASSTTPKANGTAAVGSETSSFARGDHVHPVSNVAASKVTAGTLAGKVQANATAAATLANAQVRDIIISTTDLTAGTSALATGTVYLVYE